MKKAIFLLLFVLFVSTVCFADVVGPVNGIDGILGAEYMHGRGTFLNPFNLVIILGAVWTFLIIMCIVLSIVIFKISKKRVLIIIPIIISLLIGAAITTFCVLRVVPYLD